MTAPFFRYNRHYSSLLRPYDINFHFHKFELPERLLHWIIEVLPNEYTFGNMTPCISLQKPYNRDKRLSFQTYARVKIPLTLFQYRLTV